MSSLAAAFGQVITRKPSDKKVSAQVSRSGFIEKTCWNDEALATSVVYQNMKEKERQLKEYRFKYDTLKLLYDELVSAVKQQAVLLPTTHKECQKADKWSHISAYMEKELANLRVGRQDVARILYGLQHRLSQVCGYFNPEEFEMRDRMITTGSAKVHRPDSQIDTHTGRVSSANDSIRSETIHSVLGVASNGMNFTSATRAHDRRQERPLGDYNLVSISHLTQKRTLTSSTTFNNYGTLSSAPKLHSIINSSKEYLLAKEPSLVGQGDSGLRSGSGGVGHGTAPRTPLSTSAGGHKESSAGTSPVLAGDSRPVTSLGSNKPGPLKLDGSSDSLNKVSGRSNYNSTYFPTLLTADEERSSAAKAQAKESGRIGD